MPAIVLATDLSAGFVAHLQQVQIHGPDLADMDPSKRLAEFIRLKAETKIRVWHSW